MLRSTRRSSGADAMSWGRRPAESADEPHALGGGDGAGTRKGVGHDVTERDRREVEVKRAGCRARLSSNRSSTSPARCASASS